MFKEYQKKEKLLEMLAIPLGTNQSISASWNPFCLYGLEIGSSLQRVSLLGTWGLVFVEVFCCLCCWRKELYKRSSMWAWTLKKISVISFIWNRRGKSCKWCGWEPLLKSHFCTYVFIKNRFQCLGTLCFIANILSLNNRYVCSCTGASGLFQLFFWGPFSSQTCSL